MKDFKCDKCDRDFNSTGALDMHNKAKHSKGYSSVKSIKFSVLKKYKNYMLFLVLVLVIASFFYWRSIPLENVPIIVITPSHYNFGMVSTAKGEVSTLIEISNNGTQALVINNIDTSCGCTSASIVDDGEEGPRFSMSMHGTNPKNWQQVIPPGKSVQLKVYYNPKVHKDLRGAVTRSIFIFSNAPRHRKTEVTISANQVA